jgi:hypothetical protein
LSFPFDLEAAIDTIATLEQAITTPSPGIVTSYGYNSNPSEITDPSVFPAVVHVSRGPFNPDGVPSDLRITPGGYYVAYDIDSIAMILEVTPEQYPGDEGASNLFWKSILETFLNATNKRSLAEDTGASEYRFILGDPTYGIVSWPPVTPPLHRYWGYTYTHRFLFYGGGTS